MSHLASLRVVVVAVACLVPLRAAANPASAWAAAKANLPADTAVLAGINVGQLSKSRLVSMGMPLVFAKYPEVKKHFDALKKVCSIDPWKAIEAIVIGSDATMDKGAMFVAVNGLDLPKLTACAEAVARDQGVKDAKVTTKTDGAITEVDVSGRKLYATYVGKDVLVLPLSMHDKDELVQWTAKKGAVAKGKAGKLAAKVDTKAAVWVASTVGKQLENLQMKAGYGSFAFTASDFAADLHVVVDTADNAKATAERITAELGKVAEANGALKTVAKKLSVTAVKDEVVMKTKMPESDLMQLAGALAGGL